MANERGKCNCHSSNNDNFKNERDCSINSIENAVQIIKELYNEFEKLSVIAQKERQLIESFNGEHSSSDLILSREREEVSKKLTDLNSKLRSIRKWWQNLNFSERNKYPELTSLVQKTQNLAFLILNCDRENEQRLLKIGKIPPNHIPSHQKQSPNFVARLYQKNTVV